MKGCAREHLPNSAARDDMGDEVSADPANDTCINLGDLKQGRHLGVPSTSIDVDHIRHPPVIRLTVAADHRHSHLD